MTLIDAEAFKKRMIQRFHCVPDVGRTPYQGEPDVMYLTEALDSEPTVDAEPVIRCADCANYHMPEDGEEYGRCWKHDIIMKPDDFCSRAENVWGDGL